MTRYVLIPLLALVLAGCPAKKPAAPPAGTSTPPPATSQPAPEPAATPAPTATPEPAATTPPEATSDEVTMNGTDASYAAKTDDGYTVLVTPTPIPLAVGASTWAIVVTAPAGADINTVELETEAEDTGTGKKIPDLKLTPGEAGKGTLEWTIPGPGTYLVEIHVDRGSAGDSHTKFTFTVV